MASNHALRCYDYVNQPYDKVRDALRTGIPGLFARATEGANERARSLAVSLKVDVGPFQIGTDVKVEMVDAIEKSDGGPGVGKTPITRVRLRWEAKRASGLFPTMEAELAIYPLSATETQLDLSGIYEPPFGALGAALDTLVGHRIAEASVHRLISDIAAELTSQLAPHHKT